ncbi:hypothetical protein QBC46DRAFT_461963 [Diplogelasinospora grovesii]|uniref:Actin-like ATPase domain-containing protein n=1 Tax=Diplogelasinospora grovesii TaxID=303347 RepID=A0AAN6MZ78_9PEZI|nr:hypothetical protein QBC46DRAFT_461963 [Diplogelasinospora grovesii]
MASDFLGGLSSQPPFTDQRQRPTANYPSRQLPRRTRPPDADAFVAVGIDFGTTFSGVAWAYSEEPMDIHTVKAWPSQHPRSRDEDQVPSQYDPNTGKWGYEVTPDLDPVKWFKLLLLTASNIPEDIRAAQPLVHAREKLRAAGLTAIDVIIRYLRKLWEHAYAQIRTRIDVDNLPLKVAITIPAIWPMEARTAMQTAAVLAGILSPRAIGRTTLELVQEPEAAGLATLLERERYPEIKIGESIIVCDVGGGTTDVVSYTVESTYPLRIRECVPGQAINSLTHFAMPCTGKLCGSLLVDAAFESHMRATKKLKISSLNTEEYNRFVTDDWEYGAKRTFAGEPEPEDFYLRPPARAFRIRDRMRATDRFALTKDEMETFFAESLAGIRSLLGQQRKRVHDVTGKYPKHTLLVGGLGSSDYIRNVLNRTYQGTVLQPKKPWSAVARGAVISVLRDELAKRCDPTEDDISVIDSMAEITSRISKFNYGTMSSVPTYFLPDFSPQLDTIVREPDGTEAAIRMRWYLKRGEPVKSQSPVTIRYYQYSNDPSIRACKLPIYTSESETPPIRPDDSVSKMCTIECEYDKPFSEWEEIPDNKDGYRKYNGIVLSMKFKGLPKWKLQLGPNQVERDANVSYMS